MASSRSNGFVLAELIIVLVVSSVVVVALLGGLIALVRGLQPQRVTVNGEILPIAPTFGSFPSAVRLHHVFTNRIATARAVYVFGGRHLSIPAGSENAAVQPLRANSLPVIPSLANGLPMDTGSFYNRYRGPLGEQDTNRGPDDFSIVVIGTDQNSPGVTCFVQVRRTDTPGSITADGHAFTIREVRLWDSDGSVLRYAFAERLRSSPGVFVGVVHTWMRYGSDVIAEEGPACVVFPDPWIYAGARNRPDDVPAFSRFSYLLPVSP